MRIIHVLHSHGFGGAERHALWLMQGLQEKGHDLIFAGPLDSWLAEQCTQAGIKTHHLRMSGMYDIFSHLKLRRLVQNWQPDIIHGHLQRGACYAAAAAKNIPAICTAHATTARKHMQGCRHIIAVAEAVRINLLDAGYPEDRITVIHNGVPDIAGGKREQLRKELGIPLNAFALFNAGRFIPDKGQDLLIKMMKQLPDIRLYLAGDETTKFGKQVRQMAADNKQICFMGYRADIQRLLPAFDLYISSSRREAFGLSLAEAFAASLPVLATAVGGVPEVVQHNLNGLLVEHENIEEMAAAVRLLADDRTKLADFARQARKTYQNKFNCQIMVNRVEALYKQQIAETA